jgi:hypothetical protein
MPGLLPPPAANGRKRPCIATRNESGMKFHLPEPSLLRRPGWGQPAQERSVAGAGIYSGFVPQRDRELTSLLRDGNYWTGSDWMPNRHTALLYYHLDLIQNDRRRLLTQERRLGKSTVWVRWRQFQVSSVIPPLALITACRFSDGRLDRCRWWSPSP